MDATTQDRAPLFAALAKAQATVKGVAKDSENTHHRYKYASADDVSAEGRSAMSAHGLALVCISWALTDVVIADTFAEEGKEQRYHDAKIVAHYLLTHESGASLAAGPFDMPVLEGKGRPLDKAASGALTQLHGYVVLRLLCLDRVDEGANVETRDDTRHESRQRGVVTTTAPRPASRAADVALGHSQRTKRVANCEGCGIADIPAGKAWATKEVDAWRAYCDSCHMANQKQAS